MLFPEPEIPYTEDQFKLLSIEGLLVFQVTTSGLEDPVLVAVLSHQGKDSLYRFTLPRHSRTVRKIFQRSRIREVPWDRETFNIEGVVALNIEATLVGEDKLREDLKTKPEAAFVLRDVKVLGTVQES